MAEGTYTVLARRFRPQGFADVVGQEHISQALRNAILANRVAHAYLFTGARGVGKTSTARILAKALNCPQATDGNPCNTCEICEGIAAGNDVDVLEIDGASNRGIDDIRSLRANVNVKSMRTQHKIYIIDEVHMLTKEAFNALLKTLEEPPPNVKFVFCTTEPNKLPDTILSRCQRFDFGTIETTSIKDRLGQIAQAEGVQVDTEALELVARRAAGSMRDSQSIFDQLLAFGEEHIQAGDVHRLLGTAGDDRLVEIGAAIVRRDQSSALATFHAALDEGVQLGELTDQILFYLRDLMILATGAKKVDLHSVAPSSRAALATQAEEWGLQTIVAAMQILADTKGRMQRVTYGRALAELAIVRISLLEDLTNVAGLIDSLKKGEASVPGSSKPVQKKSEVKVEPAASTQAASAPSAPLEVEAPVESVSSPEPDASTKHEPEPIVEESVEQTASRGPVADADSVAEADSVEIGATPPVELAGTQPASSGHEAGSAGEADLDRQPTESLPEEPGFHAEESVVAEQPVESEADCLAFVPENVSALWSQVVSEINDMLKSHVKAVSSAAISAPNSLELTFPPRYHFAKRFCEQPDAVRRIEGIASRLTGQQIRITLVVSGQAEEAETVVPTEAATRTDSQQRNINPEDDDFVSAVMETFSAECVRVDPVAPKLDGLGDPAQEMDD